LTAGDSGTINPSFSYGVSEIAAIAFHLDPQSGISTYMQLVQQVRHAVRYGILRPGDQLPTAREVVAALAINPNTVLKAYNELERDGLVRSRPRAGTFVVEGGPKPLVKPVHLRLRRSLDRWLEAASSAGLDRESALGLFTLALYDFYQEDADERGA
jgi:GntR family transcriptional regulator